MSRVLAIVGPTASGKTDIAIEVALHLDAEIVSVDSMQVYRGMDIGTAKPTVLERRGVVHHMIDVVEPEDEFSVAEFQKMGRDVIRNTSKPLIISGGSGLHFRALVDPMSFAPTDRLLRAELEQIDEEDLVRELLALDPDARDHIDLANKRRVIRAVEIARLSGETPSSRASSAEAEDLRRYKPAIEFTAIGVDPGSLLEDRVDSRLAEMRSGGLVGEVRRLQPRLGRTAASAIGYREILQYLDGELSKDLAFEMIGAYTNKLAKKQRTWFQRDPRIRWIPWLEELSDRVDRAIEELE